MKARAIRIDDLTLYAEEDAAEGTAGSIAWCATSNLPDSTPGPVRTDRLAAVLVEIAVDGDIDLVSADLGQFGNVAILSRTITALSAIRDHLEAFYSATTPSPGRCLVQGEWGTCWETLGHEGDHRFPTESDWTSLQRVRLGQHLEVAPDEVLAG
jgi:hypothetical protein